MRNEEIETKIKTAFEHITPDVLNSVISDIESENSQKEKIIVMGGQKRMNSIARRIAGIAAAAVILIGGASGFMIYENNYKVASTVSLDVNPSVEIQVNRKEDVLAVDALNDDGAVITGDMDFKGSSLEVTVNALIGSMLKNGYLSEIANSILISVDDSDPKHGAALQQKLADEVNALLQTNTFSGAVLSQTISANQDLQTLADTYGITTGKAQLVEEIATTNPLYSFEELANLSINELNLLTKSSLDNVNSVGEASDRAYIGADRATAIALEHAGVAESDTFGLTAELDYEKGIMVYEVEFDVSGYEYEYDIDATTGAIVKYDKEIDNHADSTKKIDGDSIYGTDSTAEFINADEAKAIALKHAGVSANDIRDYDIEFDVERGTVVYEIDFKSGNYEYEYEINAVSGSILKNEKEYDD